MDSRIHQLIAAQRLQEDIRAAAAARAAKTATADSTGRRFRRRPSVTTRRFVRRSQPQTTADR
jgi:hypothetical protein